MTREEIDRVIEEGEKINPVRCKDVDWGDDSDGLIILLNGERDVARINALKLAVKQLREEKADLTNRLTDAQDFINDRIEKGRR